MMLFQIPTGLSELKELASRYDYRSEAEYLALNDRLHKVTHLTKDDLRALIAWKSPRTKSKSGRNTEAEVDHITSLALSLQEPYLAVHTLTALAGVGISVASAIMAFVNPDVHAVMDRHSVRALGGTNMRLSTWTARGYEQYRQYLLAQKGELTLRELEQGLFMWSRGEMGKL